MVIIMNNKVLIKLIVPEIENDYDLFIPINRRIGDIIKLISSAINEMSDGIFIEKNRNLYNRDTGFQYYINDLVRETDIRNGTVLVLIN